MSDEEWEMCECSAHYRSGVPHTPGCPACAFGDRALEVGATE